MTNASFKIMLRKDRPKQDGQFPVCLRVIIGRKSKLFPLNYNCQERDFDPVHEIIKKSDPAHYQKNLLLQKILQKANKIKFDYAIEEKTLTITEFTKVFKNDNYGSKSFYEYIEYLIAKRENELSPETIKFYWKQLSKLRRFRPELTFGELNDEFVMAYKQYMIKELRNKEITWNKALEFLKRICNKAYRERKINDNPLRDLVIKRPKGQTKHLEISELQQLELLYRDETLKPNQKHVLQYFLFACYTGIRFGDIKRLRFTNVSKEKESIYLEFVQNKTNKPALIPLMQQAIELLPVQEFEHQKVFKVNCNQDTNRKLKEIMTTAGINKRITFHSSRHTCSNVLLALHVPLDVRSMILGDTKEVVSTHYTKHDINMVAFAFDQYSKALTNPLNLIED